MKELSKKLTTCGAFLVGLKLLHKDDKVSLAFFSRIYYTLNCFGSLVNLPPLMINFRELKGFSNRPFLSLISPFLWQRQGHNANLKSVVPRSKVVKDNQALQGV